jgi:hypothetical protein
MIMLINGRNRLGRLSRIGLLTEGDHVTSIIFPTSRSKFQKQSVQMAQNGSADASINASSSSLPTVVGINYGNSYASIAVVSKVRLHFFTKSRLLT